MNTTIQTAMADLARRGDDIHRRMAGIENRHCDTTAELEATLRELVALSAEQAAVKARTALLQTFDELLQATPARSGCARAGWTLSTTGEHQRPPDFGDADSYDKACVDAAIADTLRNLPEDVFVPLSLGNAVPYLTLLEAGLSEQAPAGFVACAMENLRARLASTARE